MDRKRWRLAIVRHLEDFPRQYAALEHAMASFGANFDLQQFKAAYNTSEDMDAYNRVQAVERALGCVQNYVGELAEAGVKLAALPRPADTHARRRRSHSRPCATPRSSLRASAAAWYKPRTPGHESSTAMSRRPPATCIARRSSCGTQLATSSAHTGTGSSRTSRNQSPDRRAEPSVTRMRDRRRRPPGRSAGSARRSASSSSPRGPSSAGACASASRPPPSASRTCGAARGR